MNRWFAASGILALVLSSACSKDTSRGTATDSGQAVTTAPPGAPGAAGGATVTAGPGPIAPAPGRKVIVVELVSNEKGNFFQPNEIEAHTGDVIRYTIKIGVHNVHFLPDSNTVKTGLPPASDMLQLPGQTYDVLVNFPHGKYYFQCDPHAALGMKGHLEVED